MEQLCRLDFTRLLYSNETLLTLMVAQRERRPKVKSCLKGENRSEAVEVEVKMANRGATAQVKGKREGGGADTGEGGGATSCGGGGGGSLSGCCLFYTAR